MSSFTSPIKPVCCLTSADWPDGRSEASFFHPVVSRERFSGKISKLHYLILLLKFIDSLINDTWIIITVIFTMCIKKNISF